MPRLPKDKSPDVRQNPDMGRNIPKHVDSLIEDQLADNTMFGEIIPSLMGWISPEDQEVQVNKLEDLSERMKKRGSPHS